MYLFLRRFFEKLFNKKVVGVTEKMLRDEIVNLVLRDLGEKESWGFNRSELIDKINTEMGLELGSSYCLSGIYVRGIIDLCKKFKLRCEIPAAGGSTQKFYNIALQDYPEYVKPKGIRARKGDIGILVDRSNPTRGHAYILTEDEDISQKTFEYNSNEMGSANGESCLKLIRSQRDTPSKSYRGSVDVIQWLCKTNGIEYGTGYN